MMHVFGIDVGGTSSKIALISERGEIAASASVATDPGKEPAHLIESLAGALRGLSRSHEADVAAAGIGFPGTHSFASGIVHYSPNLPRWHDVHLTEILRSELGLPVYLNNDANMAAYGEFWAGAGRGASDLVMLTLGTGIGSGAVIDGRLLAGSTDFAPELGHMTILPDGPRCSCGSKGCLEALASKQGFDRMARERAPKRPESSLCALPAEEITPRIIHDHAQIGDQLAREIYRDAGHFLGIGIANIINIFNPQLVILGGGIAAAFSLMEKSLYRAVTAYALEISAKRCRILASTLQNRAGVLGAAGWALHMINRENS